MEAGQGVDELRGHAHALAFASHAALEHVAHAEFPAYPAHVEVLALVRERRGARGHAQPRQLGQVTGEFLAETVTEVGGLARGTHVGERQHTDGLGARIEVRRPGLPGAVDAAPPGVARHQRHQHDARHDSGRDGRAFARQSQATAAAVLPDDTVGRDLVRPGQHRDYRQTDDHEDGERRQPPVGKVQRLEDGLRDLQHQPHPDQIGSDHAEHVAPPQLRDPPLQARDLERGGRRPGPCDRHWHRDRRHGRSDACRQHQVRAGDVRDVSLVLRRATQQLTQRAYRLPQPGVGARFARPHLFPQVAAAHGLAWSQGQRRQQDQLIT